MTLSSLTRRALAATAIGTATVLVSFFVAPRPDAALALPSSTNFTCIANYSSWPNSVNYKANAQWNPMFMPYINLTGGGAQLTDLNGDGLIDYLYVTHQGDQFCLYLNTGTGWTPTFRCYIERTNPIRFYGDCADV